MAAVSLAWVLAAAALSPLAASAATAPSPETTPTTAETTATVSATSTPTVAAPGSEATSTKTAPVKVAPAPKKLTVRQTIAKVGKDAGLSGAEINALLWIAKHESNYHPTSKSRSGCYGLFQLSSGMAQGHPWKNPTWNTKRAIKYMKGRYHGVLKAKAFWQSHHWY